MELNPITFLIIFLSSVLGAMGLGGGSLLMLWLIFFTDLPQDEAQALNLLLFLPTAASALLLHQKGKLLRSDLLKPLLSTGIIGAIIGSFLSTFVRSAFLRKVFGFFLLLMALRELYGLWQKKHPKQV